MGGGLRSGHKWLLRAVCLLVSVLVIGGAGIPLTILESAKAKGAVCLDGSPPAYHFDKGSGSGINSWVVHMEGGGWCEDTESCVARKSNFRGSSSHMEKSLGFSGIIGSKQASNPDFYNWNRIKIRYCDGSSFTGEGVDVKNNLFFRGERIWESIIAELLALGMKNAKNAILSGCSAGGLASILHCDKFKSLLPASARVKCVSDAGYFVHGKDISGGFYIEKFFTQVVQLHGSAKNLPASCTSRMKPELCFFPQNVAQTLKTPLFIINSAFDSYQIKNILAPSDADPKGTYKSCKLDLKKCTATQLQTVQDYRTQFLKAITFGGGNLSSRGLWIDSCYAHCQSGSAASWFSDKSTIVENTRMGKAVGDWFFERSVVKKIDCPKFPCNPTCLEVDS